MKKATKGIYTFEQVLYTLLLIPMLIGHLIAIVEPAVLIVSMLAQFLIGCAQVLSGLLHTVVYSDSKRAKYLGGALGFVLLLSFGTYLLGNNESLFLGVIFVIMIPTGIAIWYTIQTDMDRKLAEVRVKKPNQTQYDEDLLDDIQIIR